MWAAIIGGVINIGLFLFKWGIEKKAKRKLSSQELMEHIKAIQENRGGAARQTTDFRNAEAEALHEYWFNNFIDILKKEGAFDSYYFNFRKIRNADVKEYLKGYPVSIFLKVSFPWNVTPEGFDYWFNINKKIEKQFNQEK